VRTEAVTIATGAGTGPRLSGELRLPDGAGPGHPVAGIVFSGPLSGVKEQVTGLYGARLAEAGFATLAFDHRNFGASEGEPRQHEDAAGKLADLTDATSFLAGHPAVDPGRLGACGICLGGGYALRFAAFDPRIRALATVAGGYNDPVAMRAAFGAEAYRAILAEAAATAARQHAAGTVEYQLAVSGDEAPALMGGREPFDYYGTERSASPGWVNRLSALTLRELLTVDLAVGAEFISPTPWLVVHGRTDAYCSPEGAQAAFARAGEPKELVWLDTTNHIDLYDVGTYVDPAVEASTAWFHRWLSA